MAIDGIGELRGANEGLTLGLTAESDHRGASA